MRSARVPRTARVRPAQTMYRSMACTGVAELLDHAPLVGSLAPDGARHVALQEHLLLPRHVSHPEVDADRAFEAQLQGDGSALLDGPPQTPFALHRSVESARDLVERIGVLEEFLGIVQLGRE